jgi:hypothetical protein
MKILTAFDNFLDPKISTNTPHCYFISAAYYTYTLRNTIHAAHFHT